MAISAGSLKQTRIKRQSAKGTLAGATLGQIMRRESSVFELQKETYDTQSEMTSTQQVKSMRHGAKTVSGSLNGLLSPGTYSDPLSAVLRKDFAAITAIASASITIAGAGPYTITRGAGSFLTDGIKIGMVVRLTVGSFNAANLNKNLFVTNVTALVLTVTVVNGSALVTEGPISTATVAVPGKVSYVPDTSQTNLYYTVEEWYPDVPASEVNSDVKFIKADIAMPGSGNATIKFAALGLDQTGSTTVYFSSPTAETITDTVIAASGVLMVNGVAVATITDMSLSIDGKGAVANPSVGNVVRADVFIGKVAVTGSFTAYFDGVSIADLFRNETATSILCAMASGSAANADFVTLSMSNVKVNSNTPSDTETGSTRSFNFSSQYDSAGGAALAKYATSLMVCDSQAA